MDFGLTFEKLLLIGVIAAVIIGPERLPKAAESFARFVRRAGEYLRDTKSRMQDELGPEIDEVDWRKLDPRQYDPRRIIRDALLEDAPVATASGAAGTKAAGIAAATGAAAASAGSASTSTDRATARAPRTRPAFTRDAPPPFDAEAT